LEKWSPGLAKKIQGGGKDRDGLLSEEDKSHKEKMSKLLSNLLEKLGNRSHAGRDSGAAARPEVRGIGEVIKKGETGGVTIE